MSEDPDGDEAMRNSNDSLENGAQETPNRILFRPTFFSEVVLDRVTDLSAVLPSTTAVVNVDKLLPIPDTEESNE